MVVIFQLSDGISFAPYHCMKTKNISEMSWDELLEAGHVIEPSEHALAMLRATLRTESPLDLSDISS